MQIKKYENRFLLKVANACGVIPYFNDWIIRVFDSLVVRALFFLVTRLTYGSLIDFK